MHAMMSDQQVYTEEFFQANGGVEDMGNQEHYIYVSYPPEVKQHLLERYGREIYWLLKKDMYDSDED